MPAGNPQPHRAQTELADGGAYCLLIRLDCEAEADVGRLGRVRFPAGHYVYWGSAIRGLAARTARHRRQAKAIHWHIDYLLALPEARLVACVPYPSVRREECELNQAIQRQRGAAVVAPGFGSSDCRAGCAAHLTYFARHPRLPGRRSAARAGQRSAHMGKPCRRAPPGLSGCGLWTTHQAARRRRIERSAPRAPKPSSARVQGSGISLPAVTLKLKRSVFDWLPTLLSP